MDILYRKTIFIFIVIFTLVTSSCSYRKDIPPNESPNASQETPKHNSNKEDNLAKSDKNDIEENINGYDLEEDKTITKDTERYEKDKIYFLTQAEKTQLLSNIGPKKMNTVLEEIKTNLPEGINDTVQYTQYEMAYDYFLVTSENGSEIRGNPAPDAAIVANVENLDKVTLLQRVEGEALEDSEIWYRVGFHNGNEVAEGYLHSTVGTPRNFKFNKMVDAINELIQQINQGEMHYISNYKNQNGAPPQKGDAGVDEYGYRVYHSAPAYEEADTNSNYRYIPDGMLVRILGETEEFYYINAPTFNGDFYVPKQYINPDVTLSKLNHVVVVDRSQQNQASFEIGEEGLNLVSYTLSTTGFPGDYSFETTLGSYKAIEKRDRFEYLKSGTQEIAGYAPFAIRFTGGAYIHGIPVAYEEEDGEKIDPGFIEYLHTIGTFPRSNMCVRNFTSHAEFLYNWMDIQNGAFIVIE